MLNSQTEQLRTLLAVLDHGTFEAAAQALHVTASAVSQRIKAMEQAAGQVLLARTVPVTTTAAGTAVLRLARQLRQLEADCAAELGAGTGPGAPIPVVVNADSLATWFLDALAAVPADAGLSFEVVREDERHSAALLRSGAAMAAVTATPEPVQGCSVAPLGALRYRAVASAGFAARHFPDGVDLRRLGTLPVVQYDRTDTLQAAFLGGLVPRSDGGTHPGADPADTPDDTPASRPTFTGPQHFIPDSVQFAAAVAAGLGWGLLPEAHCRDGLAAGRLVELAPGRNTDVRLFWQRWKISSPALDTLSDAVHRAASAVLT